MVASAWWPLRRRLQVEVLWAVDVVSTWVEDVAERGRTEQMADARERSMSGYNTNSFFLQRWLCVKEDATQKFLYNHSSFS